MTAYFILFGVFVCVVIISLLRNRERKKESSNAEAEKSENELRGLLETKETLEEQEELIRQRKIEKEKLYGPLTRELGGFSSIVPIQIYDEKDVIFIGDRELKYKMILGYTLSDNSHTITQGGNMQAKTSTGSMIGRGIVGGVLLGGVGALAGAATAKQNIQKEESQTFTQHSFFVYIDVASPTDPLITISCGVYGNMARTIAATLNYIIHKNSSGLPLTQETPSK